MHSQTPRYTHFLLVTVALSGLAASGSFVHADNKQGRSLVRHAGVRKGVFAGRVLNLAGSGQRWTYLCKHSTVQLNGSGNFLSLKGTCTSIDLYGSQNVITLNGTSDRVVVNGSNNRLRIIGTMTSIEMAGSENHVTWTKQTSRGIAITITGSNNSYNYKP